MPCQPGFAKPTFPVAPPVATLTEYGRAAERGSNVSRLRMEPPTEYHGSTLAAEKLAA